MQQSLVSLQTLLVGRRLDSVLRSLVVDPQSKDHFPNAEPREVLEGHYVRTKPQPLTSPYLVAGSSFFAETCLGLDKAVFHTDAFVNMFGGGGSFVVDNDNNPCWATSYAVSVFGHPIVAPDPFGRGNGYGDGRAMSVGEYQGLWNMNGTGRWELQLKGCGTTPYSRGADGRAVLRSSVREYLVSNAMHHLGVPSTLALSLVGSQDMTVDRPWYPDGYRGPESPPFVMQTEHCAITCRAAPSFVRIGQFELFSRRAMRGDETGARDLERLLHHAIEREYADEMGDSAGKPVDQLVVAFSRHVMRRMVHMAVEWIRVGYVQGNMNSDNMLVGGNTLDYGPFGFVERFEKLWTPFTSDPDKKFGFLRQTLAMQVNVVTLIKALLPLLRQIPDEDAREKVLDELQGIAGEEYGDCLGEKMHAMLSNKMGLSKDDTTKELANELWTEINDWMEEAGRVDYTIFWRELARVAKLDTVTRDAVERELAHAFYEHAPGDGQDNVGDWDELMDRLMAWILKWHALNPSTEIMLRANPKFVFREWILVEAYEAAKNGDNSVLQRVEEAASDPYREGHATIDEYYRKTPKDMQGKGGVAFFS